MRRAVITSVGFISSHFIQQLSRCSVPLTVSVSEPTDLIQSRQGSFVYTERFKHKVIQSALRKNVNVRHQDDIRAAQRQCKNVKNRHRNNNGYTIEFK